MPRFKRYRYAEWARRALRRVQELQPQIIAVDTETTGLGYYDTPFGATVTWRGPDGLESAWFEDGEPLGWLADILELVPVWVFHNAKFDLQKLLLAGIIERNWLEQKTLHDTATIYRLLDENGRAGLKHLAATVLGVEDTIAVEVKSGPRKGEFNHVPREAHALKAAFRAAGLKKDDGYHLLPREVVVPYALKDTEFTLLLFEKLMPMLRAKKDERLLKLYEDTMQLKLVLLDMEANGFALDLEYLEEKKSEYGRRVMEGWRKVVDLTGDEELNPQSPPQITEAFAKRGVKLESTAVGTLSALDDELATSLLSYRSDKKIHTTYLVAISNEQRGGIIHPNFNDDAARTGRMSSGAAKE